MKKVKLFFCFLSLFLLGGMVVSCTDSNEREGTEIPLDGAWLVDDDNGIIVFEGTKFKYYESDWTYTADIESYFYGTWSFPNSKQMTLTYIGKYENGIPDKSFDVRTETLTIKGSNSQAQAISISFTKESGETLTLYKYTKMDVEQYLKQYLVGKWDNGSIILKSDGTFVISEEYGYWSVSGKILTLVIEGCYNANNKVSYDTPKIKIYEIFIGASDEMYLKNINPDESLDQGGGFSEGGTVWKRAND